MPIIGPLPAIINPGDLVSAGPVMADFNYIVSQVNANAQPTSLVSALKTSGVQTFTTVPSKVAFNTAPIDLGGNFDTSLYRFTATVPCYVFVDVAMILANSGQQIVSLLLYKSGVTPGSGGIYAVKFFTTVPTIESMSMSGLYPAQLTAGEYLEVFCYCNTGSVTTDASGGNRFNIIQVR
jgi:hypothetical protein